MASVARADIEALLRARKLDTTLTTARPLEGAGAPAGVPADDQFVVATGVTVLDQCLGGGLARGQMSEIVGPRSSGRTSLVLSAMAGAASRGELVALVDTFDMFDPPSARACGVDLSRLLWVRGSPPSRGDAAQRGVGAPASEELGGVQGAPPFKIHRALKSLNLILQAGGFGLVVLDLADAPPSAIRRLPFTTWFRLQRPIEGSSTACVLLASEPTARSAGGVTVALRRIARAESQSKSGASTVSPARQPHWGALFTGFEVEADVRRARGIADTCRFSCAAAV